MEGKKNQKPKSAPSRENSSDSPPMSKKRKPLQKKGKQFQKKGLDPDLKSELVVSAIPGESRSDFPSFVKTMVPSNVTTGFWLHLPKPFCRQHLPKEDAIITLEDESEQEYKTNYIVEKTGLSGGWKTFTGVHKLLEGDVLDFHLVAPSKFKVYIKRANDLAEVDGVFDLLNLDVSSKLVEYDGNKNSKFQIKAKRLKLLPPPDSLQEGNQRNNKMSVENSEYELNDFGTDASEDMRLSGSVLDFKEVKSIDNFKVLVNGYPIDSELSDHHKTKYYELCCSQKSFLHDRLLKSINAKLAAEIISSMTDIADTIRASKISTPLADFATWDKTMEGFQLLGMNVGFLRTRVNRLMILASGSERYNEAKRNVARIEKEMRTLKSRALELKQTKKKLDAEMEAMRMSAERTELIFEEEVNAPWILETVII